MTDKDKGYWTGFGVATAIAILIIIFVLPPIMTRNAWLPTYINGVKVLIAPDGEYYKMPKEVKLYK